VFIEYSYLEIFSELSFISFPKLSISVAAMVPPFFQIFGKAINISLLAGLEMLSLGWRLIFFLHKR